MQLPWYVAALGAAVTWGIYYPLVDMALKRISLYSVILLSMIPVLLLMPLF
jgi:drug/metabolite transporter (DMT)-like permease